MLTAAALAAIGTAITFAPAWDSYTLRAASGATQTLTAGNAFANPAPVIIGDVVVMVALVGVVIIAALWRPVRLGAVLLAGAAIPMVAQAISALVQVERARIGEQLRHLRGPGRAGRAHLQQRGHAGVLDLLRVRGGAAHRGRVDVHAAASGEPGRGPARGHPRAGARPGDYLGPVIRWA